jgi:hypothetical protein
LRRLALPRSVKHWSLTTLREKLIKIGAKVVTHSRYVTFQMAEVAVPSELFAAILDRIQRFGVPPPLVQRGWRMCPTKSWRFEGARGWRCAETGRDRPRRGVSGGIGRLERGNGRGLRPRRPSCVE